MKRNTFILLLLSLILVACNTDDIYIIPDKVDQTLFMYFPWSTNLTSYFEENIEDMENAISRNILGNQRVIVFFQSTETKATLFELKYHNGECRRHELATYINPEITTVSGITSILNDVKRHSPSNRYAMAINGHGMGWLPASMVSATNSEKVIQTRWFGGQSFNFQTDISIFSQGIASAGMKMEYIMFDDCYMSCVEIAYELRNVTDYLIASPCPIMAHGMPYDQIAEYMIGKVDYEGIANAFVDFYLNESKPYGAIGVTDCRKLDELATIMKEINSQYIFDTSLLNTIQSMDGYSPVIFFDFGDYVSKLCPDEELLARFNEQLELTVPSAYKKCTNYFFTANRGTVKVNTYTGLTISDPSIHEDAWTKTTTSWYRATH